jgi:hypothetical protein
MYCLVGGGNRRTMTLLTHAGVNNTSALVTVDSEYADVGILSDELM